MCVPKETKTLNICHHLHKASKFILVCSLPIFILFKFRHLQLCSRSLHFWCNNKKLLHRASNGYINEMIMCCDCLKDLSYMLEEILRLTDYTVLYYVNTHVITAFVSFEANDVFLKDIFISFHLTLSFYYYIYNN